MSGRTGIGRGGTAFGESMAGKTMVANRSAIRHILSATVFPPAGQRNLDPLTGKDFAGMRKGVSP